MELDFINEEMLSGLDKRRVMKKGCLQNRNLVPFLIGRGLRGYSKNMTFECGTRKEIV